MLPILLICFTHLPMSERRMLIVRCTDNRSEGVAARYRKLAPHAAGGDWVIDAGEASLNPVTWDPVIVHVGSEITQHA